MTSNKPKRDNFTIQSLLAEYQFVRWGAEDAKAILSVGAAAKTIIAAQQSDHPGADLAAVMFLGSVLVEYAIVQTIVQLDAAGATDDDHDMFLMMYERVTESAHVVATILSERELHPDAEVVVKSPNTVVLVDDAGVEVAGFQIDTCNAPGSSEAN